MILGRGPSALRLLAGCLALGGVVAALHLFRPALLARADLTVYDRLLSAAPLRAPSGRVALVEIDERSLIRGGRWPWPRDRMSAVLDRIRALGAAAVGVDVLFAEPDTSGDSPAGAATASGSPTLSPRDAALAVAVGRGVFVIGYAFTFDRPIDRPCHLRAIGLGRATAGGALAEVPRAAGVLCSLGPIGAAAMSSGFMNASPDADGILRRMPQIVEFGGEIYPSLALATVASVRTGIAPRQLTLADRVRRWPVVWLQNRRVSLDADGSLLVRFRGPAGTFPHFSAVDVLEEHVPAGALAGRIVFVGVSALGLGDMVATPLGTFLPGVEIHATVADNLLRGDFVRRPPGATLVELALALAAAAGVALAVTGLEWRWTLPLALGGGLGLWLGTAWLLGARGWYVSPLFPTLALVGALGIAALHRLVAERARADQSAR